MIDAEFANQPSEISKKKNKGGKIGSSIAEVCLSQEIEEKREIIRDVVNDYDRFERGLVKFQDEKYFDFVLNDNDLCTLPPMSIFRINSNFEVPEKFDMFNFVEQFKPFIAEQITADNEEQKDLIGSFVRSASADIPVVIEMENISIAGKLNTKNLFEEYADLEEYYEQEVYFLCKVVGIVNKEQVEIFNPFKDFIKFPRTIRRKMDKKDSNPDFEPIVISGPVLKVEVIAIYK